MSCPNDYEGQHEPHHTTHWVDVGGPNIAYLQFCEDCQIICAGERCDGFYRAEVSIEDLETLIDELCELRDHAMRQQSTPAPILIPSPK